MCPRMQDNAYLHPESWRVLQVTAWIPMLDATPHNGCMQVRTRLHSLNLPAPGPLRMPAPLHARDPKPMHACMHCKHIRRSCFRLRRSTSTAAGGAARPPGGQDREAQLLRRRHLVRASHMEPLPMRMQTPLLLRLHGDVHTAQSPAAAAAPAVLLPVAVAREGMGHVRNSLFWSPGHTVVPHGQACRGELPGPIKL